MCNESLSFVERNLQNGSRGVEMKLEVGKIYLNECGDPVFIWKRYGERFSGLDVKYNMLFVYDESGVSGIINGDLVCEYSKPTLDLIIRRRVVVKDGLGHFYFDYQCDDIGRTVTKVSVLKPLNREK